MGDRAPFIGCQFTNTQKHIYQMQTVEFDQVATKSILQGVDMKNECPLKKNTSKVKALGLAQL